jgi:hypothetical protein
MSSSVSTCVRVMVGMSVILNKIRVMFCRGFALVLGCGERVDRIFSNASISDSLIRYRGLPLIEVAILIARSSPRCIQPRTFAGLTRKCLAYSFGVIFVVGMIGSRFVMHVTKAGYTFRKTPFYLDFRRSKN